MPSRDNLLASLAVLKAHVAELPDGVQPSVGVTREMARIQRQLAQLKPGAPTRIAVQLSQLAVKQYKTRSRECYNNSTTCAIACGYRYVLGYAYNADSGVAVEHAWCETTDGYIVEVTPSWLSQLELNRYYPAIKLDIGDADFIVQIDREFYLQSKYNKDLAAAARLAYASLEES